jgi:hypothetical protein
LGGLRGPHSGIPERCAEGVGEGARSGWRDRLIVLGSIELVADVSE